jgi:hypothetical protein
MNLPTLPFYRKIKKKIAGLSKKKYGGKLTALINLI